LNASIKGYLKKMQKKFKIGSKIDNLRIVENVIDNFTNEAGIGKDSYGKIMVATLEAVNNAVIHGNKSNINKYVEIEMLLKEQTLYVTVKDQGKGFAPENVPDPTLPENIELIDGRGIFLMSRLADNIEFNKKGNAVVMTFKNILP
jgi:serine/threonine-protein kinase RsbW